MGYSVITNKTFFIRKDSNYPLIKYPLLDKMLEKYDITEEMLENIAVTFSMIDSETGQYKVANSAGSLTITNTIDNPEEEKYTLTYKLKLSQTTKSGNFIGEFCIDFLDYKNCQKLKLPLEGQINIIITDSITKTTVI